MPGENITYISKRFIYEEIRKITKKVIKQNLKLSTIPLTFYSYELWKEERRWYNNKT